MSKEIKNSVNEEPKNCCEPTCCTPEETNNKKIESTSQETSNCCESEDTNNKKVESTNCC